MICQKKRKNIMDVNFEYYKIFYYVAKYHNFTKAAQALNNYPLISLGRETMTYKFYNSVFLSHGLDLSPDTEAATADQILPLVKCELGLAFLPQPMAAPSLLKKEIVQIPLKDEIPERQICLVYDSQHPMGAAARELKNTIVAGRI